VRTTVDPGGSSLPIARTGHGFDDDGAVACVARARAVVAERGALPLPGHGRTIERWGVLADVARDDLSVARIVEGHADAVAILDELEAPVPSGLLGVWAARPQDVRASGCEGGWILEGRKPYCSGADLLDVALVTATSDLGPSIFSVATADLDVVAGTWSPFGMAATRSATMRFDCVALGEAAEVGGPGRYVGRPGFGHGGCGVAACWWGGAARLLAHVSAALGDDDLSVAAYGRAAAGLDHAGRLLRDAAEAIDASPDDVELALGLAAATRNAAADAAHEVLGLAARHLGTSVLGHDAAVAARIADLTTYLTQHKPGAAVDLGRWHRARPPSSLC
jgi:alkylation response protein AidB-like acyl-CoA dehydrogenase